MQYNKAKINQTNSKQYDLQLILYVQEVLIHFINYVTTYNGSRLFGHTVYELQLMAEILAFGRKLSNYVKNFDIKNTN